jgi:DNA-binding response OmpR family regulator
MILLVTHEIEFAKQMGRLLEAQGYPVTLAFEGSDVPTLMTQENLQLIIVNLYVQNPSGLEVLRQLRAQGYAGKIIVLGGYSASTEIRQALLLGIDQILGQPVSYSQLDAAVHVAIGHPVKNEDHVERPVEPYSHLAEIS